MTSIVAQTIAWLSNNSVTSLVPIRHPRRTVEAYNKATAAMPPLLFTLRRQPDQWNLEVRQAGPKTAFARMLDLYVEATRERLWNPMNANPFGD